MAYQPKSYRKFVAGTVTAAVVASAVAPVASAATPTFSDVPANHQFAEAINALAADGTFIGQGGKFDMYGEVTRRQAAVVFSRLIDGEGKMEQVFSDVPTTDGELTKAAYEVNEAGVMTGANGKLMPYSKLTRQQMAKIIVEYFDFKPVEGSTVEIKDLDKADASLRDYIQILAENGITQVADGNFRPTDNVSRGQFAAFIYRAQQAVAGELAITGAEVLSTDGRYLEVQFNKAVGSVDKSDFEIRETGSSKRVGIESAKVSSNGKAVELVAYDAEEDDEIKEGKEYTVTFKNGAETLSYTFERPYYIDDREDNARVIEVDAENQDFTVSTDDGNVTIDVPTDITFDYEEALGMEVRVWYTGDKKLIKAELANTDVFYDAFEVTEAPGKDKGEIELQVKGSKLDLATDNDGDVTTELYIDGVKKNISDLKDADYAKVILDDKGDVAYIYAYNLSDVIVVDKVENNIVDGLGDDELDLEDFVIVKGGKTIKASDLKAGDTLYFNETIDNSLGEEGYAVVYNNVITGEIEAIYDDAFVVKGEKYDYDTIKYVDEDGDIQDEFNKDDAEDFEGSEVTIYVDQWGDVRLITGSVTEGNSNTLDILTTDAPLGYQDAKGKLAVEVEFVDVDGKEVTKDVLFDNLDEVTIDGQDYDIDQDDTSKDYSVKFVDDKGDLIADVASSGIKNPYVQLYNNSTKELVDGTKIQLTDNAPVKVGVNDNNVITSVEFFTTAEANTDTIEADDSYAKTAAGNKRLSDDTLVYVAKDGADTDADDIKIYKFKDITFDVETGKGVVFYNEDGDVEYIVVSDTVGTDTTDFTAVVTDVQTNDDDVVRLKAWVDGKEQTYTVDEVEVTEAQLAALKTDGTVVQIEVNDESGVVEDIFFAGDADEFPIHLSDLSKTELIEDASVNTVNSGSKEFTLKGAFKDTTFKLASDAVIVDAEDTDDIDTATLRDIEGKVVDVVLDSKGSRYVQAVIIRDGQSTAPVVDTTAPKLTAVESVSATNLVLKFDEALYVNGTAVKDGVDIASLFTAADNTPDNAATLAVSKAEYDVETKSVTFTVSGAGNTDTIKANANTLKDAAGNAYVNSDTLTLEGGFWVKK